MLLLPLYVEKPSLVPGQPSHVVTVQAAFLPKESPLPAAWTVTSYFQSCSFEIVTALIQPQNRLAVIVLAAVVTAAVIAVVLAAVAAAVLIAVLAVILVVVLAAVVAVVAVLAVIHIVVIVFHGSYLLIGRFICYRSSMAAWKKNIHTTWKNWNIFKIINSIWFLSPFLV